MTGPQERALRLLEIQDARRGWADIGILQNLQVQRQTLNVLIRDRLVEMRDNGLERSAYRRTSYRLTAYGETKAKAIKSKGAGPHG